MAQRLYCERCDRTWHSSVFLRPAAEHACPDCGGTLCLPGAQRQDDQAQERSDTDE